MTESNMVDFEEPTGNRPILSKRNIWDHWAMPDYQPRESQKFVLDWMANLPADAKYIFCQIPVGGGKSPIAVTYSSFLGHGPLGTSYILTPQRILQRQYEESFTNGELVSVYGKANYFCTTKLGLNCDIGDDIKPKCVSCPAKQAFASIRTTPHVVLNYKLALLYSELFPGNTTDFPVRDLMVFDECHTLENNLVSHRAVSVSKGRCEKVGASFFKPRNLKEAHQFIVDQYFPAVDSKYFELEKSVKGIDSKYEFQTKASLLPSEIRTKKEYKEFKRYRAITKRLAEISFDVLEKYYVLMVDKTAFEFKEIYGANLFNQILKPKADRFLFMSSTILDFNSYARDLGIPEDQIAVVDMPSEFAPSNRPVYFMPTAKMSYGWHKPERTKDRDKMLKRVVDLCNAHEGESGIVHTGSFQVSSWLVDQLESKIKQRVITHNQDENSSRDECIEEFTENEGNEPMVLVSPSCTEGLDLMDDTARFAIFVKVPFPFLGDEWVKRRKDLSEEWYMRQAMISIIQGGGRVVRSPEDWGNTYILDESFGFLWNKYKKNAPQWWKDAFTVVS
jgi:Rad3-related DNA helicase